MSDQEHFIEKRNGPWDRRIPNMPRQMGFFLRFLYKTKRRLYTIFAIALFGWIWFVATLAIWLHVRFPGITDNLFRF